MLEDKDISQNADLASFKLLKHVFVYPFHSLLTTLITFHRTCNQKFYFAYLYDHNNSLEFENSF